MRRQEIVIGFFAVAMIALWNDQIFLNWKSKNNLWSDAKATTVESPLGNSVSSAGALEPKLWRDIKKTSVSVTPDGKFQPTFDESVLAENGKRVELTGVGFLLSSGLRKNERGEEEVTEFLLLPAEGGVAWCCGLTPISKHEFSVLVACPDNPFSASEIDPRSPAFFAKVEGTLRLEKENSINALYTLEVLHLSLSICKTSCRQTS